MYNCAEQLKKFRSRKRKIQVWKRGTVNEATGFVEDDGNRYKYRGKIVFKMGLISKQFGPRKPLREGESFGAALNFYVGKPPGRQKDIITATVEPKDIVGVSFYGDQIDCNKATITKCPMPNQQKMRRRFLNKKIKQAKRVIPIRKRQMTEFAIELEEMEESLQNMKEELKQI